MTENGGTIPWSMEPCDVSTDGVWTGTVSGGTSDARDCNDWQSDRGMGLMGSFGTKDSAWTECAARSCDSAFRLYCVESE
jgi:hypothetical protein